MGKGVSKYLGYDCHMEEPHQLMYHRIEQEEGEITVQGTTYCKIPEDRQEKWSRWLAERVKVGFVGMKGYLTV